MGCGRFDFAPAPDVAPAIDAAPDAVIDCTTLGDGAPCDDDDICTADSSCLGGACVPSAPAGACMVADSQSEYAATQGTLGWYYGYWWAELDPDGVYDPATDFIEMTNLNGLWRPPDYNPDTTSPSFTWAYMAAWGGHPGANPLKIPVRRWVSDVHGRAAITVFHRKSDSSGGDGTRATVMIDGRTIWQHIVAGTDGVGVTVPLEVELAVGSRIDFLLDPVMNDAIDTTEFGMTVASP